MLETSFYPLKWVVQDAVSFAQSWFCFYVSLNENLDLYFFLSISKIFWNKSRFSGSSVSKKESYDSSAGWEVWLWSTYLRVAGTQMWGVMTNKGVTRLQLIPLTLLFPSLGSCWKNAVTLGSSLLWQRWILLWERTSGLTGNFYILSQLTMQLTLSSHRLVTMFYFHFKY